MWQIALLFAGVLLGWAIASRRTCECRVGRMSDQTRAEYEAAVIRQRGRWASVGHEAPPDLVRELRRQYEVR